jgi:hypothetical protein
MMTETPSIDYDYAKAKERAAAIRGLRDLADFLEAHPGVPFPAYNVLNANVDTKDEIARIARLCSWEKDFNGEFFSLRKRFGGELMLDVYTSRDQVCRRVVKGTKTLPAVPERTVEDVEWVCDDALLGERKEGEAGDGQV